MAGGAPRRGVRSNTYCNRDDANERRKLANLTAILRDPLYVVSSKIIPANRWVNETQKTLLPGDLLVCFAGHLVPIWPFRHQPVSQILAARLPYAVYILNSPTIKTPSNPAFSHRILGWVVSIVMILLFLGFDVRIVQDANGWIGTVFLGTAMLVEAGLIWTWNTLWD